MNNGTQWPSKTRRLQSVVKSSCLFAHPNFPSLLNQEGKCFWLQAKKHKNKGWEAATRGQTHCMCTAIITEWVGFFSGSCDTEKCPFTVQPSVLPASSDPCQLPGWPAGLDSNCTCGTSNEVSKVSMAVVSPCSLHGRAVVKIFLCFGVINIPGFRS